ncbi:hypothetical protein ACQPZF_05725 [Actinosynnema sp. CS-041913]|uniref:hypothetical protein n=1 Tax=Actinosynnema sp. CS-041913 TaxID=3239917 RepID=UPI003D8D9A99
MPQALSLAMLQELIDIPCPGCGYEFEIQLLDIRVQTFRLCPCCRVQIHFVDDGSLFGALQSVDESMRELRRFF